MTTLATKMGPSVRTTDLRKRFGLTNALRGVNLQVRPGERVAIFGPNGSGKTTLMRILAGVSRPTKGSFDIGGATYGEGGQALRCRVGVVGHHPYLYEDLTAEENLLFYSRMFVLDDHEGRVRRVLAAVDMEDRRRDRVGTLSRGMQQRVALARAILHDPDLLLMDEPDTGLDQQASEGLGRLLENADGVKRTVILATHNLRLGMRLSDRFVILVKGRIVYEGSPKGMALETLERLYSDHVAAA